MRGSIVGVMLFLAGCCPSGSLVGQSSADGSPPMNTSGALPLLVSVGDLMEGEIAFSTHIIEDIASADGAPASSEWGAVRIAVSNLSAAATLLTTPNANLIDALRKQDAEWFGLAKAMQDVSTDIAGAAFMRDEEALSASAKALRKTCQACHARFGVHGE